MRGRSQLWMRIATGSRPSSQSRSNSARPAFARSARASMVAAAPVFTGRAARQALERHGRNIRGSSSPKGPSMIKVHILQVNSKYATEVARAGAGRDRWLHQGQLENPEGCQGGRHRGLVRRWRPSGLRGLGLGVGVSHRVKPGEPFWPLPGPGGWHAMASRRRSTPAWSGISSGWTAATRVPGPCRMTRLLHSSSWLGSYRSSRRARIYTWPRIWHLRRSGGTGGPDWLNIHSRVKLPDALEAEVSCRSAAAPERSRWR